MVASQAPQTMGFSRQEYWSGLPCPPPGDLSNPGIKPVSLKSSTLAARFFTISVTWKAPSYIISSVQFSSVQSLSHVWLFATPWTACSMPGLPVHHQLPEFTQTHVHWVVMPSNHLILCHPLLLLPSIFPSIKVFSNESALRIRWPLEWVAIPFSRESSQPRVWTQISYIAGRLFTIWVTREAPVGGSHEHILQRQLWIWLISCWTLYKGTVPQRSLS